MASVSWTAPLKQPIVEMHIQPSSHACIRINLNHDKAWQVWREKAPLFKEDLAKAWEKLSDMTKTIASKHNKSVRCVEKNLYLGDSRLHKRQNKMSTWNAFSWKMCSENNIHSDENSEHPLLSTWYIFIVIAAASTKQNTLPDFVREYQTQYSTLSVLVYTTCDLRQNSKLYSTLFSI